MGHHLPDHLAGRGRARLQRHLGRSGKDLEDPVRPLRRAVPDLRGARLRLRSAFLLTVGVIAGPVMKPFQSIAMQRALAEAQNAGARGEVPVGAVLAGPTGEILAADGNRTLELRDPTAHAEMLVIRAAA